MNLYDEIIERIKDLLPAVPDLSTEYRADLCAASGDKNAILLRGDTAFELGGSGRSGVCSVLFGTVPAQRDEVALYGKDLCALKTDAPFAHLTLIQLKDTDEKDLRYEKLTDIGFRLFQVYPKGYHIRFSPYAGREQVRVAKDALIAPALSFLNVGCSLIRQFKAHDDVAFVKTVFITAEDVDYTALSTLSQKAKRITDAVEHSMKNDSLDCASCKMKPICDEVEGLRTLHFKKEQERKQHGT